MLLTGDTADKVKAAALAAVPGGTIERVENDAEGSPYEAHMTKADGSHVTVKVDASFNVTGIEDEEGPVGAKGARCREPAAVGRVRRDVAGGELDGERRHVGTAAQVDDGGSAVGLGRRDGQHCGR